MSVAKRQQQRAVKSGDTDDVGLAGGAVSGPQPCVGAGRSGDCLEDEARDGLASGVT